MRPDDDPGWPPTLSILVFLVPGVAQWYLARHRTDDGLVMLRRVFLSFAFAIVAFGIVLAFLRTNDHAALRWLPLVIALAAVSLGVGRAVEKPLDCANDETLSTSYRQRFFLRIAFAEAVALFAFVFAFIGAATWVYDVGAVITLISFWTRAAPTRAALARDQEALNSAGCNQSLVTV